MPNKNLLKGFRRPKGITFEHSTVTSNCGKFVAYPFERGFGTTIGNTLRRALLSSIQGYAITAVRITSFDESGSPHFISSEFDSVPEVVEDTPEIMGNLRQLKLRLPEGLEQTCITVECKGPGDLTGENFALSGEVEVANSDFKIATLMENARFDMEIQIELGRGYSPAEASQKYIDVVGTIPIDALFSPVKKVQYTVGNCRVGQRSDYDKLEMEITTDGTVAPEDCLAEAAKILKEHFSLFINFDDAGFIVDEDLAEKELRLKSILDTPVDELELSVRSSNCLKNANINTLRDLTTKTEEDIVKTRNFGKKSLLEIKEKLAEWDLSLGMYSRRDGIINRDSVGGMPVLDQGDGDAQ